MLLPLWLVNYAITRVKGGEVMDFESFIDESMEPDRAGTFSPKRKRTGEEIMAEFAPFIEADKKRGDADG